MTMPFTLRTLIWKMSLLQTRKIAVCVCHLGASEISPFTYVTLS